MAAYINEDHFPINSSGDGNQYIELRGMPSAQLEAGTYLVVIHSSFFAPDTLNRANRGDIHTIFDLSNQAFGANGLLVLMQSLSRYAVGSEANLLKGTDGFRGMPGNIFSADNSAKDILPWSNTYLLIQSAVPPALTDNIDGDSDGVPSGVYENWKVLDGFSILSELYAYSPFGYAPIAFCERYCSTNMLMPGSTRVFASGFSQYVGRTPQSTGYAGEDWVVGGTEHIRNADGSPTGKFQLTDNEGSGATQPPAYGGRFLDHVGAPNWTGSASGIVFRDDNADGVQQLSEPPIAGVKVFADLAGDSQLDFDTEQIEPNDYPINSSISNISNNATLASQLGVYGSLRLDIRPAQRAGAAAGEYIFAHAGNEFFNEDTRLRIDFYQPAKRVRIDVIGNSSSTPTYGRLQIFTKVRDIDGLFTWRTEFIRSPPLSAGQRATLSLSFPGSEIVSAVAYAENSYENSSPFGMFDNLQIVMPEQSTTTDINGNFTLPSLTPGKHTIFVQPPPTYDLIYPSGNGRHTVTLVGTENRANFNFGLLGNLPPKLADLQLSVSEATTAGSLIAELSVARGYPSQRLKFSIASGDPDGLFNLDSATGRLTLDRAELDFEQTPNVTLNIKLEDTLDAALNDTAILQLTVDDANEPPVVAAQSISILENSPAQTIVATVTAEDADSGIAGQFTWSIASGNTGNAFSVDPATGVVRINDASKLDYESAPKFNLVMRATDRGEPAQTGEAILLVELLMLNEAPVLIGQALSIKENSASGQMVGMINASDPDADQSREWSVIGGSGFGLFEIGTGDGKLIVANGAKLDYETTAQYDLVVKVTDTGTPPLSDIRTFTITVADINESPSVISTAFKAAENLKAGELIAKIIATDQDTHQQLRYSITGGDASAFTVDAVSGEVRVAAGANLDYETDSSLTFQVKVTDDATEPLSTQADVTLTILDLNEAPELRVAQLTVPENSLPGSWVGVLEIFDPDFGDQANFALLQQTQDWVSLDAESGQLVVANGATIDFEGDNISVVTVQVTDRLGLNSTATLTIAATNRNDAPTVATPLPDATATVYQPFSYTIPLDSFTDADVDDSLRMIVTTAAGFPIPSWLTFSPQDGVIFGRPGTSDGGVYDLRVTVVDVAGSSTSDTLSIVVNANLYPWHNTLVALDANGDGKVSAIDALWIINHLNTFGPMIVPVGSEPRSGWLDTSGDNAVSAKDVLLVVNELNGHLGQAESEMTGAPLPTPNIEIVWSWNDSVSTTELGGRRRR